MNIIINRDIDSPIQAAKITITLNDDVEMQISQNQFGELVIRKAQYGNGDGDLIILPSVSNEIRIK